MPNPVAHTAAPVAAPVDLAADAARVLADARRQLALRDGPLECLVLAALRVDLDEQVDTMRVRLAADGVAEVHANPAFLLDIGVDGTAFVLAHEAFHIVLGHLGMAPEGGDPIHDHACEAVVNHQVLRSGHHALPVGADGTTVGVDPVTLHESYRAAIPDGLRYREFIATDLVCAAELGRVDWQVSVPTPEACDHGTAEADDRDAVDEVLVAAVRQALAGDDQLRQQLLHLPATASSSEAWGRVGGDELRGTAARLGDVHFWRHHLRAAVGRLLRRRSVVAYDRKVGWWDRAVLASIGLDLPAGVGMPLHRTPRPHANRRRVAVYLDMSGSIADDVVQTVATTIGPIADTDVDWHTFDTEVHPFEPGDPLPGGGGTDFEPIAAHVADLDPAPDAVLVLTDGFAPPIRPDEPDRWIWLLVPDGDDWPATQGMTAVHIDLPGIRRAASPTPTVPTARTTTHDEGARA